jgi:hypothetical protein
MSDLLTAIQIACVIVLAIGGPGYAVLRLYWRMQAAERDLRNERLKNSRLEREVRQLEEALAEAQRRTPDVPQDRTDAGDHTLNTSDAA